MYHDKFAGMCRFVTEVSPARRSQQYDEGLPCTPELETAVVTSAVWQGRHNSRNHTSSSNRANHDDGKSPQTNDVEAAAAAAAAAAVAAVVAETEPSPQTNERRTAKEAPRRHGGRNGKLKHLLFKCIAPHRGLRIVDTIGPILLTAFVSYLAYVYVALSGQRRRPLVPSARYLT